MKLKTFYTIHCFFILYLILNMKTTYSQFECRLQEEMDVKWGPVWDCNPDINGDFYFYGDMDNYIPNFDNNPLRNPPQKTIRLNFNIFQKTDGSGNYPNNLQTRETIRQIVDWVNYIYSVCDPSNPVSGVQEIEHSYVQFDIGDYGNERIYFYADDNLWKQSYSMSF